MNSACPKVRQGWLDRDNMGQVEVVIHQPATHPEGKFPAKERGDVFIPFTASFPFPEGNKIMQELQIDFSFHPDQFPLWIL